MNLLELQRRFEKAIASGGDPAGLPLAEPPKGTRASRLESYAKAYWLRQIQALLEDFPSVTVELGAEGARELAREYLGAHPSRYASLSELGRDFAGWLALHPLHARLAPEAELEWLETKAERAPEPRAEEKPKDFGATIVALGEEGFLASTMVLHPSVQLCASQGTLVYRREGELWREELCLTQLRLLEGMRQGMQVASLLEWLDVEGAAESATEEAQQRMMGWFETWVREGVIMGVLAAPKMGDPKGVQ